MRKLTSSILAIGCLAMGGVATSASAATVIETYDFTVTGASGSITEHSGSLTFSYDDEDPTILTLLEIDFMLNDFVFDLTNTDIIFWNIDGWLVGGTIDGINTTSPDSYDFFLGSSSTLSLFAYTTANPYATGASFSPVVTQVNGAVPEPSTWLMLLLGFFAAGAALRSDRRRPKVTVSYA